MSDEDLLLDINFRLSNIPVEQRIRILRQLFCEEIYNMNNNDMVSTSNEEIIRMMIDLGSSYSNTSVILS